VCECAADAATESYCCLNIHVQKHLLAVPLLVLFLTWRGLMVVVAGFSYQLPTSCLVVMYTRKELLAAAPSFSY
jgi:hypothetical protein